MSKRKTGGAKKPPAKKRTAYEYWSKKDEDRLRRLFPDATWEKLVAAFPGRNRPGIARKAHTMQLSRAEKRHGSAWTKAEEKKLAKMWPQGSTEDIRKAFPGRSWGSIKDHARQMNLKKETISTWNEVEDAVLRNLYPSEKKELLLRTFGSRTWQAIQTRAQHLGVKRKAGAAHDAEDENVLRQKMVEFLARARTEEDFVHKFGKGSADKLQDILNDPPSGFFVKSGLNRFQEQTFYLSRRQQRRKKGAERQPSVFAIQHSKNDPDYISVIFPQNLSFSTDPTKDALRLFPIDSSYWGDHLCDKERLTGYINWLESKPYAFAFLNGGNIGGTRYNKFNAEDIRDEFIEFLRPVAHKIMWAQSGDLELRMQRVDNINPLEHVCHELGIYHTVRPVMADIYWKFPTKPIEIVAVHGRSNAHLIGSKVNAVNKVAIPHNFPHFTVMGRLMAGHSEANTVRRLDPVNLEIKEHVAYSVLAPGFRKHAGSVQEQKGYAPTPKGTVAIIIRANNEFMASS